LSQDVLQFVDEQYYYCMIIQAGVGNDPYQIIWNLEIATIQIK